MSKTKYIPIIGEQFTKWTVISDVLEWKGSYAHFFCKCECGKEKSVSATNLHRGVSTNCGCTRYSQPAHNYGGIGNLSGRYFTSLKRGAKQRELEFNVTIDYLYSLFNGKCKLSNMDITLNRGLVQTASLDRIDSNIGYIEGNVQWIHKDINMIKKDLNQDYFISICKLIASNN